MARYQVIGKPTRRVEGAEKATGHARYAADVSLPGTLWGKSLHSTYAHARIVRIDTTAAKQVPGVHAVITGVDVRGGLWGRGVKDVPVLAYDRVRFFGERVAAVAADDEDIAQRALELIEVEYEELPAVYDPLDALKDDAPILHPDFNAYVGFPQKMEKPSNAYHKTSFVAYEAAQEAKRGLLQLAAKHLGWPEASLFCADDEIRRTDVEEAIRWTDLLARAGESITGRAHIEERGRSHITSFAAQVAEVSVDPETGQVKLLRFTTAHDVGQIVNPIGHLWIPAPRFREDRFRGNDAPVVMPA